MGIREVSFHREQNLLHLLPLLGELEKLPKKSGFSQILGESAADLSRLGHPLDELIEVVSGHGKGLQANHAQI